MPPPALPKTPVSQPASPSTADAPSEPMQLVSPTLPSSPSKSIVSSSTSAVVASSETALRSPNKRRRCSRVEREEQLEILRAQLCDNVQRDPVVAFSLSVRKCPRKGLGVFTEDFIPANAFVIEYRGDVLTGANLVAREKKYDQLAAKGQDPGSYMFYFRHDGTLLCVDGTSDRGSDGVGRLINHSRLRPVLRADKVLDANYQPHICLFALDDIAAGTELTFDYGERDKDVVANLPWLQDT